MVGIEFKTFMMGNVFPVKADEQCGPNYRFSIGCLNHGLQETWSKHFPAEKGMIDYALEAICFVVVG